MAEGPGQQVLALQLMPAAVLGPVADGHLLGALQHFPDAGNGQAAFRPHLAPLGPDDLGVDEDELLGGVFAAGAVDHRQVQVHAHLRRREAHALLVEGRLEHVGHELLQLGGPCPHILAVLLQSGIAPGQYGQDGHAFAPAFQCNPLPFPR